MEAHQEQGSTLAASHSPSTKEFQLTLPVAILIAGVMISGTIIYATGDRGAGGPTTGTAGIVKAAKADVSPDDDPSLGETNAPVTIIEFSDFQCPFCRSFSQSTFPQIKSTYIDTGKVRFVYRDYPLSFHPAAEPSAEAGGCAADQGKFWEYHDKIYLEQAKGGSGTIQYGVADLKKWAKEIGLNTSEFNSCLDSGKYKDEVAKDLADGSKAGVTGTPGFFINGKLLTGAQPFAVFQTAIDAELE